MLFSEKVSVICVIISGLSAHCRGDYCKETEQKRQEEKRNLTMNNATCFLHYIQLRWSYQGQ